VKTIRVNLKDRSYNIYTGTGIINKLTDLLDTIQNLNQIALISTPPVADLYLNTILSLLNKYQNIKHYLVPDGEKSKSLKQAEEIYTWLIQNNFDRNSLIIGLGGGVVGDLSGFIAATFLRGVRLVHIPTTLLAQLDSSIGGKVGVNHALGKNLIGAFYQPQFVISDVNFLQTLKDEEFICGMGEVVKYALIRDPELYSLIDSNFDSLSKHNSELMEKIVSICANHKAEIVSEDELERGIRAILNFGHTFGHALESFYQYDKIKHGQAVLLGMICAVFVSQKLDFIDSEIASKIIAFIEKYNIHLPGKLSDSDVKKIVSLMQYDKKIKNGKLNFILIRDIGKVIEHTSSDVDLIIEAFKKLKSAKSKLK